MRKLCRFSVLRGVWWWLSTIKWIIDDVGKQNAALMNVELLHSDTTAKSFKGLIKPITVKSSPFITFEGWEVTTKLREPMASANVICWALDPKAINHINKSMNRSNKSNTLPFFMTLNFQTCYTDFFFNIEPVKNGFRNPKQFTTFFVSFSCF